MTWMINLIIFGVFLVVQSVAPTVGYTQNADMQRAVELARNAKQHVDRGELYEATEVYREALRIIEHPDLLLKLARTEALLKNYSIAHGICIKTVRSPLITPEKRKEASACIDEMYQRMNEISAFVATTPSGASIRIDGQHLGRTPWEGTLAPGQRQFDFELEGYQAKSRRINATPGNKIELRETLLPQNIGGLITLRSVPDGANVMLDDHYIGRTPLTNFPIQNGAHQVDLILSGHLVERKQVYINEGSQEQVTVYFKPERGRVSATDLWPAWSLMGAGVLTGALGGFFGYQALDSRNQARQLALTDGTMRGYQEYILNTRDMNNATQTADLLWVTSGVMLTSGVIWWLIAR